MTVSELARHAGVPSHVVRYYARIGLLHPRKDPGNGYKKFNLSDVCRLQLIRSAQSLGFTLAEISQLLDPVTQGTHRCCTSILELLRQKIAENQQKLNDLCELQRRMEGVLSAWGNPDGCNPGDSLLCPRIQLPVPDA